MTYMQNIMRRYVLVLDACLQNVFGINASFAVDVLINSSRQILGHLLEKFKKSMEPIKQNGGRYFTDNFQMV
ncbi:unnamed protein product, partial [Allacma fusca]